MADQCNETFNREYFQAKIALNRFKRREAFLEEHTPRCTRCGSSNTELVTAWIKPPVWNCRACAKDAASFEDSQFQLFYIDDHPKA